jgi:hypothetical protein
LNHVGTSAAFATNACFVYSIVARNGTLVCSKILAYRVVAWWPTMMMMMMMMMA